MLPKALILFVTAGLAIVVTAACGKSGEHIDIDWVSFIRFGGTTYLASPWASAQSAAIDREIVGPEFARVRFKVADNISDPSYRAKDGDSAFLEPGTAVYTVTGYRPEFLLAAVEDGKVMLYVADTVPGATRGNDLLDIGGKVGSIRINSPTDGSTEIARLDDPAVIDSFVSAVLDAPVEQDTVGMRRESPIFIAFHLHDGIVIQRAYFRDSGELQRNIQLPQSARDLIEQTVGPR